MKPKKLDEIKTGSSTYIDSNIFIYNATNHPNHGQPCKSFLNRIEVGELSAITSALTLTETLHKLTIINLCKLKDIKPFGALKLIKKKPTTLKDMDQPYNAIGKIQNLSNLKVVSLTPEIVDVSLDIGKTHFLMSNDVVHLATMKVHKVTNLASNDSDFERVPWVKLYKPKKI